MTFREVFSAKEGNPEPRRPAPCAARPAHHTSLHAIVEIVAITAIFGAAGAWPVPVVNEVVYLTKARHAADPSWCAGDFFTRHLMPTAFLCRDRTVRGVAALGECQHLI